MVIQHSSYGDDAMIYDRTPERGPLDFGYPASLLSSKAGTTVGDQFAETLTSILN